MKTSFLKTLGLFAALTSISIAAPITGSIGFAGAFTANNTNLTVATSIASSNVIVLGETDGSFDLITQGTAVSWFTPLVVNQGGDGKGVVLPNLPIWSVGGFALTLDSIWELSNTADSLALKGWGTVSNGNPADDSAMEWVGTFNKSGSNFTFSASSSSISIPDGGTTAMLLGLALLAVGAIARRSSKA